MDEIIHKILALSICKLEPTAISELQYLMGMMENVSLEDFLTLYNLYINKHPNSFLIRQIKSIEAFITEWASIHRHIQALFLKINIAWKEMADTEMGGDYYLPLIIQLIPNNPTLLKSLISKLEALINVCPNTETGFFLNTLMIASAYRLSNPISSLESNPDKYELMAIKIHQLLYIQSLRDKLITVHQQYITYLKAAISVKLKTEIPDIYASYYSIDVDELIINHTDAILANILVSETLRCLIQKLFRVKDLERTLKAEDYSALEVLTVFTDKYARYKEYLQTPISQFDISLKSWHSYYMVLWSAVDILPIRTPETTFHEEAMQVCHYLNQQQENSEATTLGASAAAAAPTREP